MGGFSLGNSRTFGSGWSRLHNEKKPYENEIHALTHGVHFVAVNFAVVLATAGATTDGAGSPIACSAGAPNNSG